MTTERRLVGAALGLALLVAACGGSSSSPSPTAAPATQAPAASEAAATEAPAASEAAATEAAASTAPEVSMPEISLTPGAAGDLEAMLPATVGSVTFQKTSVDGSQMAGAGTPLDTSKVDPLLSKYGKSIADVRMAIATGSGGAVAGMPDLVYAIQLKGVPASEWATQLDPSATGKTITVGGKQVVGESTGGLTSAYYTHDDILFMVIASDKDAAAIISALP
jgi:hypothetical protein